MSVESSILKIQLELSESEFIEFGSASYRPIDESRDDVRVSHDDDFDHVAFTCDSEHSDWRRLTPVLEFAILPSDGIFDNWKDGVAVIRYSSEIRDLMSEFVLDLIVRVENTNTEETIEAVVAEWSDRWKRSEGPMGLEKQKGLLGELIVLDRLVDANSIDSLDTWVGPHGSTHDFKLSSGSLEVKTAGHSNPTLRISSFNQLHPVDPGLKLVMVQLRSGKDFTLPDVINALRQKFAGSASHSETFEKLIELVGYYDDHALKYAKTYSESKISYLDIDMETEVLHQGKLVQTIDALIDAKWLLNPFGLPFKEASSEFWSTL